MKSLTLSFLAKYRDGGLLLMRVGLGLMFIGHGFPKLMGGPEKWAKVGDAMSNLGITFAPEFWGFMAGAAEFGGGVLLMLGLFTRPALIFLIITMVVAAIRHLAAGDGIMGSSHSIEAAFTFLGLFFIGPGKYSIDSKITGDDDV